MAIAYVDDLTVRTGRAVDGKLLSDREYKEELDVAAKTAVKQGNGLQHPAEALSELGFNPEGLGEELDARKTRRPARTKKQDAVESDHNHPTRKGSWVKIFGEWLMRFSLVTFFDPLSCFVWEQKEVFGSATGLSKSLCARVGATRRSSTKGKKGGVSQDTPGFWGGVSQDTPSFGGGVVFDAPFRGFSSCFKRNRFHQKGRVSAMRGPPTCLVQGRACTRSNLGKPAVLVSGAVRVPAMSNKEAAQAKSAARSGSDASAGHEVDNKDVERAARDLKRSLEAEEARAVEAEKAEKMRRPPAPPSDTVPQNPAKEPNPEWGGFKRKEVGEYHREVVAHQKRKMAEENRGEASTVSASASAAGSGQDEGLSKWRFFIGKALSRMLRHGGHGAQKKLSRDGWALVSHLASLSYFSRQGVGEEDILDAALADEKHRFECREARQGWYIRAPAGHSEASGIDVTSVNPEEAPPDLLYHFTKRTALKSILERGLLAGGLRGEAYRKQVHLVSEVPEDLEGRRGVKADSDICLEIDAKSLHAAGQRFYSAGRTGPDDLTCYLTGSMPPKFVTGAWDIKTAECLYAQEDKDQPELAPYPAWTAPDPADSTQEPQGSGSQEPSTAAGSFSAASADAPADRQHGEKKSEIPSGVGSTHWGQVAEHFAATSPFPKFDREGGAWSSRQANPAKGRSPKQGNAWVSLGRIGGSS